MAISNFRMVSQYECMNAERRNTQVFIHINFNLFPISHCRGRQNLTLFALLSVLKEDAHFVINSFQSCDSNNLYNDSLVGLFDGHGGRGTVDFVSHALPQNLEHILQKEGAQDDIERSLRAAFLLTDIQTKDAVKDRGSGATGVCCFVRRTLSLDETKDRKVDSNEGGCTEQTTLYVANCGDSRAVLCHDGRPLRLTYDHKGEDVYEQKRIATAQGFTHGGRTLGILAVSRSFGDHAFKEFVTADPHLTSRHLAGADVNPFLIVCCDGVWDVISDDEAVEMVAAISVKQRKIEQCEDATNVEQLEQEAAKYLVEESLKRGSSDNLSAIVLFF